MTAPPLRLVRHGATLFCDRGVQPSTLIVARRGSEAEEGEIATISDFQPTVNIASFGLCTSIGNPAVLNATTAANGVLTPMPCVPLTQDGWTNANLLVTIQGMPVLTQRSTCLCSYAGTIIITDPNTRGEVG